jgi:uroporphyrinogen-III synthase
MTKKIFEAEICVIRKNISALSVRALERLDTYDGLIFASKHAVEFFAQELKERKINFPSKIRVAVVGPFTAKAAKDQGIRVDVITERRQDFILSKLINMLGDVKDKRILFPRSAIAPNDEVLQLRKRGALVTVVSLYTTKGKLLSKSDKKNLLSGVYGILAFKSPSAIDGLLKQFTPKQRLIIKTMPASCLGPTTSRHALEQGFRVKRYINKAAIRS